MTVALRIGDVRGFMGARGWLPNPEPPRLAADGPPGRRQCDDTWMSVSVSIRETVLGEFLPQVIVYCLLARPCEQGIRINENLRRIDPLPPKAVEVGLRALAPFLELRGEAVLVKADFPNDRVVLRTKPRIRRRHRRTPSLVVSNTPNVAPEARRARIPSASGVFIPTSETPQ